MYVLCGCMSYVFGYLLRLKNVQLELLEIVSLQASGSTSALIHRALSPTQSMFVIPTSERAVLCMMYTANEDQP